MCRYTVTHSLSARLLHEEEASASGTPLLLHARKEAAGAATAFSTHGFDIFDEVYSPFTGAPGDGADLLSTPRRLPGLEVAVGVEQLAHANQQDVAAARTPAQRCLFSSSCSSVAGGADSLASILPLPRLIVPSATASRALQLPATPVATTAAAHPAAAAGAAATTNSASSRQQDMRQWLQSMELDLALGGTRRCKRLSGCSTPVAAAADDDAGADHEDPAARDSLPPPAFVLLGLLAA